MKKIYSIAFCVFMLGISSTAGASEIFSGIFRTLHIDENKIAKGSLLGLGVLVSQKPYKGVDAEVYPVPIIVVEYDSFFIDGKTFGYTLNKDNPVEFSIIGKPRFMGYESGDSSNLAGMSDRDWSLDAGLQASWENELFTLDVTALADTLNNHQGQELSAVVSKEFFEGALTPRVGVKWQSEDIVDYYYGVLGTEAAVGRSPYEGNETTNFVAGIALGFPLNDEWALVADIEYEHLGSSIQDSPIVDEKQAMTYVGGIVYRF